MIKNKKTAYVLFIVLFTALWYFIDYLYNTFITKSGFKFELGFDFATTVVLGAAIGYIFFLREKRK
ncbi:MAG: hypothetical protein J5590_01995 [Clostridia bacterium]|nr:hypothetical protein [Clostridia bacterium]